MKGKCKMKTFLQHIRSALVFVGIFIPMTGKADVWALPENKTYYSENKEYKLIITPKIFPDKYNLWQYYTSAKHVKVKRFSRKKEKFMKSLTAQDTILIPCTAELYWTNDTSSILLWKKTLLNDICPVHAKHRINYENLQAPTGNAKYMVHTHWQADGMMIDPIKTMASGSPYGKFANSFVPSQGDVNAFNKYNLQQGLILTNRNITSFTSTTNYTNHWDFPMLRYFPMHWWY